jgi:hypothetical protein
MPYNHKKSKYPAATLAFYGPTDQFATKAVVGIIPRDCDYVDLIHKWITTLGDIRADHKIGAEIRRFLKTHNVKSVVTVDRIIGCPHEEGKDYPEGTECPQCPFWAGRDRFTGEMKK